MHKTADYETQTRNAYRSGRRASEYKKYQTRNWNWARFSTWREQRILARELSRYSWSASDLLLDIPCGTGISGKLLRSFPLRIVAGDISMEMMELAREEYLADRLIGCVQADITKTGFKRGMFACIMLIGFLHRVPQDIKHAVLSEISALTNRIAIITCSVDSPLQRLKRNLLSVIRTKHIPAPCPVPLQDIISECEVAGFKVVRSFMVVPFLSSEALLVLEKRS